MKTKMVLTADDAALITAACKAEAEMQGWKVSVAIVDDAGRLLSAIRYEGAGYGTVDVARRKAETSAMSRQSSAAVEKMVAERLTMLGFADRLPLQGALPVIKNGDCLGAVGVSGGLSPQDEQVARAGLEALKL